MVRVASFPGVSDRNCPFEDSILPFSEPWSPLKVAKGTMVR